MKNLFLLIIIVALFSGCSKDKVEYEVYNPQAFVYYLMDGWELNATVRAKGFEQKVEGNEYKAFFSLDVHLITPAGDTLKSVAGGYDEQTNNEKFADAGFEVQIELDSTFIIGDYKIIFEITDEMSKKSGLTEAAFSLKEE